MTNIFESLKDLFTPMADNERKNPLHIGEVNHFWLLLTLIEEGIMIFQLALNTTTDDQLMHALSNGHQSAKEASQRMRTFFINEGIPLPPSSEDKPKSDPNAVPLGVKYTDEEIANLISAKVAAEITLIGQGLALCVRNDACKLLMEVQVEIFKYGSSLKKMMRERGWLKVPPYYYPPGAPTLN